jgi:crotonobetainyl-CoA:carnitine CoA-transferase CaiB-like acyl-CoA transferase
VLTPHRIIDLTGERGAFAGFMLAQFGADVVLVEPPDGRQRDSTFDAYNRGKRSVSVSTVEEIEHLASTADVVIVDRSFVVDGQELLLDLDALRETNPALITVSITPFGSTGPKSDWLATDLTVVAASGQMAANGDGDRPPVRISVPQTWCHAGAQAAVGALIALEARRASGFGQHVDVSAQQAAAETAVPAILHAPAGLGPVQRVAGGAKFGSQLLKWVYECADGWSIITLSFGQMIGPKVTQFMHWMYDEGFCDEATRDKNYVDFARDVVEGRETLAELERITGLIEVFALTKTKAELLERGLAEGLLIAPVSNLRDVLDSPQLAAREFWQTIDGESHPGPLVKASTSPLPVLCTAPAFDADGEHIRAERRVAPTVSGVGKIGQRPLEGLKVCDLSWVAAAPLTTKILAHWGADVVRIESVRRQCLLREALGHRDNVTDPENAIMWHSVNANKRNISLNLSTPEARDVVRDLVAWSDVVLESFTPGTLDRWGLGYDDLRAINPQLIVVSSCVMGQSGPYRDFAGFGNMSASVAGFFDVTGWPDRLPAGPYMAYTDYTSPRFTAAAILAALDHRRATGEGQYLDFSQMEAATHFLTPALLDYQRTGEMPTRRGNKDSTMVPHSVYRTHGQDNWIAIVCENDEQWRSLANEMRRKDLADLTNSQRRAREEELDAVIAAWTTNQIAAGLQIRLQMHGIAAHQVQKSGECFTDPQLVHRDHFHEVPHPVYGHTWAEQYGFRLSRSDGTPRRAGPTWGEHNFEVLSDLLGYDGDKIAELVIAGVLE